MEGKMKSKVLLLTAMLTIAGCSADNDSGLTSVGRGEVPTNVVAGKLVDGPISGSRLELRSAEGLQAAFCGDEGMQPCQAYSDASGVFSFTVKSGEDIATLNLWATYRNKR